ncbi:hypothetical protein HMPREF0742_01150 [Rothia aeria F0184]|uniref:Uncharacterized protein n=1 Tax=Rothia aeria F0184 TaxID=888019 RepID=U7V4K5_9MICC|nr:hypothetical protein HMPREF0742_01150 [Rothia aeria F0184]
MSAICKRVHLHKTCLNIHILPLFLNILKFSNYIYYLHRFTLTRKLHGLQGILTIILFFPESISA